jgi:hypothetical protein
MSDKEKVDAYARYYLARFRDEVMRLEAALLIARDRLKIAEREYADGEMVTGEPDGIPALLRGVR